MKLSVQLVTWNGERYIPKLLESLRLQTFKDWELLVLDNASTDKTVTLIENFGSTLGVPVKIIKKERNSGFAPAHNELFLNSKSPFLLVLNQDVLLEKDVFERLILAFDSDPKLGSASPRLMRLQDGHKTNVIDSLGLVVDRKRKFSDRAAGLTWSGQAMGEIVFGVSGTVAAYRRSAVESAAGRNLFEPSYFAYQEDIDIAWQLQLKGFTSKVLLEAVAFHNRTTRETKDKGLFGGVRGKRSQSPIARYNSYKNHLATLYKNEQKKNFILDFPFIIWYELMKFCYFLLFEREVLGGLRELWNDRNRLRTERKRIQSGAVTVPEKIRKFWKNYA